MKTASSKRVLIVLSAVFGLLATVGTATQAKAAFLQTQRRYVTPLDLFSLFHLKFPGPADGSSSPAPRIECLMVTAENRTLLGDTNPASGKSNSIEPTPAFDEWYRSCLAEYIKFEFFPLKFSSDAAIQTTVLERLIGPKALESIQGVVVSTGLTPAAYLSYTKWQQLPEDLQMEIIRFRLRKLLGPDGVILDKGIVENVDDLRNQLYRQMLQPGPDLTAMDALMRLSTLIALREEFLIY